MSSNRSPWFLPAALVAVAAIIYFTFILTRNYVDQSELLGLFATYFAIFLVFAAVALLAYRMLRRSRSSEAMDEGRSRYESRPR